MGYRSDAVLVITRELYNEVVQLFGVKELLDDAERHEKDNCFLFFWGSIKWGGNNVESLFEFLGNNFDTAYENYLFCRTGEEMDDNEEGGGWYDNPFNCRIVRLIDWDSDSVVGDVDPALLKSKNTSPNSTHCYNCKAELKDPMPGCPNLKFCPICEP
ncbi:MAG: hypothetical protein WC516_09150 [Patescibacteria group bacterium]|jgi:hypothetical protein